MTNEQKARTSCIYRVHSPLIVVGQYIPEGAMADLSDVADVMLRWLLERKMIETASLAEGEQPFNTPTGAVERPPCPGCGK